jgi:hypothetical protein
VGTGAIPFVDIGGRYLLVETQFEASDLSCSQMARSAFYLTPATSATSRDAEAAAGYLVVDLCVLTHDRPAVVCSVVPANLNN